MKAIFNKDTNSITEQAEMEKPKKPLGPVHISTAYSYDRLRDKYDEHIASLRTIPCSPSCADLWKDGQVVEEGRDYEVIAGTNLVNGKRFEIAEPVAPTEQPQEDIWQEFMDDVYEFTGVRLHERALSIARLQKKYHIVKGN